MRKINIYSGLEKGNNDYSIKKLNYLKLHVEMAYNKSTDKNE